MHFPVKTNPLFCFTKYVNSVVCFFLAAQTKLLMTWKKIREEHNISSKY